MPLAFLVAGLVVGVGAAFGYSLLRPQPQPVLRTVMTRFLLPVPVATCKQVMALAFRVAGFAEVTPDAGNDPGVGAPGGTITGAALCMPVFGAASVAMSGAEEALLLARMKAFADAVAATNYGGGTQNQAPQGLPPAQPQQRR